MKALAFSQTAIWLIQLVSCGFSFSFLFNTIARILFVGKLVGMRVKLKVIVVLEITGVSLLVALPLILGWRIYWWEVLISFILSFISICVAWYDDSMYVYIEEDLIGEV